MILSLIVVVLVFAVDGVVGVLRDEMRVSSTMTMEHQNNQRDKRKLMRMKHSKTRKKTRTPTTEPLPPAPPPYKTVQLRAVQLEPQVFINVCFFFLSFYITL